MRIRTIKPEFWRSDDIAGLSIEERLLFIGLWSYVDDNGVGVDTEAIIAAELFAHDLAVDALDTLARVSRGLARLAEGDLVLRYTVGKKRYLLIANWQHQKIDHPAKPRYPFPNGEVGQAFLPPAEGFAKSSRDSHETVAPVTGEQGNRGTGEQGESGGADATPTTPAEEKPKTKRGSRIPDAFLVTAEMRQWAADEVPGLDVNSTTKRFVDHWRSASGQSAVKIDWVAAWRNWLRRDHDDRQAKAPAAPRALPTKDELKPYTYATGVSA